MHPPQDQDKRKTKTQKPGQNFCTRARALTPPTPLRYNSAVVHGDPRGNTLQALLRVGTRQRLHHFTGLPEPPGYAIVA